MEFLVQVQAGLWGPTPCEPWGSLRDDRLLVGISARASESLCWAAGAGAQDSTPCDPIYGKLQKMQTDV